MAQKAKNSMNASKIIGIQFSVLSPEEIRKSSVAEITSRDTYINNKPVINGLFDPRMGVLEPGLVCPTDGLNYMQTPGYFGHINLARPVYYIQYLTTILKVLRCVCFKCSKLKINKEIHKHILDLPLRKRWEYCFAHASKIKRCGDETSDGCGCKQPRKIYKHQIHLFEMYFMRQALTSFKLRKYPDRNHTALKQAIGKWHSIDPSMILPGNGAAELITWSGRDASECGISSLPSPCFSDYKRALKCWNSSYLELPLPLSWDANFPQFHPMAKDLGERNTSLLEPDVSSHVITLLHYQ